MDSSRKKCSGRGDHRCKALEVGKDSQHSLLGQVCIEREGWREQKPPLTEHLLNAMSQSIYLPAGTVVVRLCNIQRVECSWAS